MNTGLCEKLKEKRKNAKLTQAEVANRIGVTQSAYAYYENGRNEPDIKTLTKLAELFETSIDYLVGRYSK